LQQDGSREGVLIESWETESSGQHRPPFTGIKGDGWVYVEPQKKHPRYYLLADGESVDHYATLDPAQQQRLASQLAALRKCAGSDCLPGTQVSIETKAPQNHRQHDRHHGKERHRKHQS
jgi:hypothetical protein